MKRVRMLFVNHSTSLVGGSSQSLRNLIMNLDEKVDMILPKDLSVNDRSARGFYGPNIDRIYRFHLPFRKSISLRGEAAVDWNAWFQTEMAYRENKKEILQMIEKNKYDVVHLNSYVLYPLLTRRYPMYIHVRETCDAGMLAKTFIKARFRKSHGIIYIDESVRKALGVERKSIVLNNPFDQRKVLEVDLEGARRKYSIDEKETVFTYIAATSNPVKGSSFVADAFIKAAPKDSKLLIVGPQRAAGYAGHPNVIFTGKISQMEEIYAVSDHILRGDNVVAIGRTIYEGLYSGCGVIIPGNKRSDMDDMFEKDRFRGQISFYKLRDMDSLVRMIQKKSRVKKRTLMGLSNVEGYVQQFKKFVLGADEVARSVPAAHGIRVH